MAEFDPQSWGGDDLQQEIEKLWAKVSLSSTEISESAPLPSSTGPLNTPVAWEAVSLLKGKYQKESRSWAQMLEVKEKALSALQERHIYLEKEVADLRRRLEEGETQSFEGMIEAKARLEAGLAALREERQRHGQEQLGLKALLEQTRERMRVESELWKKEEQQWGKKEQQYLLELKGLEAMAARHQEDVTHSSDEAQRLAQSLKEAKNALEKTLAELLRERQIREETEKERAKAMQKVDDVEKHFQELSKIWEEERGQWRELWDRERSTWETQRTEFAEWEQKLRQEREAWHAELQAKEQDQIRYAAQMAETLRQSTEATSKIQIVLKAVGALNPGVGGQGLRFRPSRGFWAGAAAFILAAAAAFPLWQYYSTLHFKRISVVSTSLRNPTGLAYDGVKIWIPQWDGSLEVFDPRNLSLPQSEVRPVLIPPYHPVSAVFANGSFWTLDAAQARLIQHTADNPGHVISYRQTSGPAPTALATDGKFLWNYDAANRSLYRFNLDGDAKSFPLNDVIPTALLWVSGRLWAFDSKTRTLAVLSFKDENFKLEARYDLGEAIIGMTAVTVNGKTELWVLAGPSNDRSTPAFVKFSY